MAELGQLQEVKTWDKPLHSMEKTPLGKLQTSFKYKHLIKEISSGNALKYI